MTPASGGRCARRSFAAIALVAVLLAACGATGTASPSGSGTASTGPATPTPGASGEPTPGGSVEPTPTVEPTEEPSGSPPGSPTGSPSIRPSPSPTPTISPGIAAECAGSDDNRDWFARLAQAVAWDVYCPVLPTGWFVVTGSYHLAAGGKMDITYRGPGSQRIEILEGAYCAGASGCPPTAPDAGPAAFGDRDGHLVDAGGGSWVVVAPGGEFNWQAKGIGMDGPTLAGYTAAFARVAN